MPKIKEKEGGQGERESSSLKDAIYSWLGEKAGMVVNDTTLLTKCGFPPSKEYADDPVRDMIIEIAEATGLSFNRIGIRDAVDSLRDKEGKTAADLVELFQEWVTEETEGF